MILCCYTFVGNCSLAKINGLFCAEPDFCVTAYPPILICALPYGSVSRRTFLLSGTHYKKYDFWQRLFRSDTQIVDKNIHIVATNLSCCYKLVFSQQLHCHREKLLIPTIIIVSTNNVDFLQQPCKVSKKTTKFSLFYSYFYA
jgi:hypothetical protein